MIQRIAFTDGDRMVVRNAPSELPLPWRVVGLPAFIYDGDHTFDLAIRHPDNCECPWGPKTAFEAADA